MRKAPPPPRFTRQPTKEKMFLALLIFARLIFSKMERTFFFLGFCPPSIRAVWRGFNSDLVLRKLFSGIWIFAKPRLICFWILSARRSGEESARGFGIFWRAKTSAKKQFSFLLYGQFRKRTFLLWRS